MKDKKEIINYNKALFGLFFKTALGGNGQSQTTFEIIKESLNEKPFALSENELKDIYNFANLIPGSSLAAVAAVIGYSFSGVAGALAALFGAALPSLIIFAGFFFLYKTFGTIPLVAYAFKGIAGATIFLMLQAAYSLFKNLEKTLVSILIFTASFVLLAILKVNIIYVLLCTGLVAAALSYLSKNNTRQKPKEENTSTEEIIQTDDTPTVANAFSADNAEKPDHTTQPQTTEKPRDISSDELISYYSGKENTDTGSGILTDTLIAGE